MREFDTGAVRDSVEGKGNLALLPPAALIRLSQLLQKGSEKYAAHNWRQGMPFSAMLDSMTRHLMKYLGGVADGEDHLAAVAFGALGLMEFEERIKEGDMDPAMDDRFPITSTSDGDSWVRSLGPEYPYAGLDFWAPIPEFPGYEASLEGDIRHGRRILKPKIRPSDGRKSYGPYRDGKNHSRLGHHLVLQAWVGPLPPGCTQVRHLDGDAGNNRLSNLAYGTATENEDDKVRHGTHARGENHGMSALTELEVHNIWDAWLSGSETRTFIAYRYDVSLSTINHILTGRNWRHVYDSRTAT